MDLLVNDLSIHKQFQDFPAFRAAMERIMEIRQMARKFGRALHCHRNMAYAQVTPDLSMLQAIQQFNLAQRRVLIPWLYEQGPFWEEIRRHGPNELLTCKDDITGEEDIVTDTAVGEAAYCCLHRLEHHLVSLVPSSWKRSPVQVAWMPENAPVQHVDVVNHWDSAALEVVLQAMPVPLSTWIELQTVSVARFTRLKVAESAFAELNGQPFVSSAAQRVLSLLGVLNQLKGCFDEQGNRTPDGQQLYQEYFTGDRARFSDSSESEKRQFGPGLTFPHPDDPRQSLFCPWHGKIQTPQFRIHFSWPVRANEPLYVVYVGPKITKR